jgi:hypothetical protein
MAEVKQLTRVFFELPPAEPEIMSLYIVGTYRNGEHAITSYVAYPLMPREIVDLGFDEEDYAMLEEIWAQQA